MTTPSNPAQRPSPAIEGLLPCPFCGGSNIEALDNFDWICCQDCGASLEDVEPSARELWNTRSSSAAYTAAETDDLRKANEILHGLITNRDAEIERLRACIRWTDEVYPDRIYGRGARVELTWDEFNAMREAAGFRPAKMHKDEEGKSGHNHRLRARIKELEATPALPSTDRGGK